MAVSVVAAIALAVAMGIGRFAFTPLLPLMIREGSLPPTAGAWLGASNYAGYLAGALTASRLGLSLPALITMSLAGTAVSTAAMGVANGLPTWVVLRWLAGLFSAWTLVASSAWALERLAQAGRPDLAGVVYSGVGLGITLVGSFCLVAARPGVATNELWLELGAIATFSAGIVPGLFIQPSVVTRAEDLGSLAKRSPNGFIGLVICYGALGFGYILPATFLPALAREVIDDPKIFGLAWPLFGTMAALSTVATAYRFRDANRLRVWAFGHVLMAIGVVLPSAYLSPASIAIAAVLVGSTFMIVTMTGMQEARAQTQQDATARLGLMTAAFAIGQLAGPLVSGMIDLLPVGHRAALGWSLQLAASALAVSAAYLWVRSNRRSEGLERSSPTCG